MANADNTPARCTDLPPGVDPPWHFFQLVLIPLNVDFFSLLRSYCKVLPVPVIPTMKGPANALDDCDAQCLTNPALWRESVLSDHGTSYLMIV